MQLVLWMGLDIVLLIAMLIVVPFERIKELFVYGLVGGILLAIGIFLVFSSVLKYWTTVGSIQFYGIGLLPIIGWFFPTVIFGNYFPKNDSAISKVAYVLLFAVGSVVMQIGFVALGMWRNYNWNYLYTFLLAIAAHTFLALYIMRTEHYLSE